MLSYFKDVKDLEKMVRLLENRVEELCEKNTQLEVDNKRLRDMRPTSYEAVAKDFKFSKNVEHEVMQMIIADIEPMLSREMLNTLKDVSVAIDREKSRYPMHARVAYDFESRVHEVRLRMPALNTSLKVFDCGY